MADWEHIRNGGGTPEQRAALEDLAELEHRYLADELDLPAYLAKRRAPDAVLAGWISAHESAVAAARARFGPSARFGYTVSAASRNLGAGRRYYVHIEEQLSPLRVRLIEQAELDTLLHRYGVGAELVILDLMR